MKSGRAALFFAFAAASGACSDDSCKNAASGLQLDVRGDAALAGIARVFVVGLDLGTARYERTYELGDSFSDGETSFGVTLGAAANGASTITISVRAENGFGVSLADTSGSFPLSADGCNQFTLTFAPPPPRDGGVDAGDDSGGEDGAPDTGEPMDGGESDALDPDATEDGGPPPGCGDGVASGAELCDDGNTIDGDGCSSVCAPEPGFLCRGTPSACVPVCGDGLLLSREACDDGNIISGDGCTNTCNRELGYNCAGGPCVAVCGDGLIRGREACDDTNTTANDGCNATCAIELGYDCQGEPSDCVRCGNGLIGRGEQCDDNNTNPGDGCSAACALEAGFSCSGAPTTCVAGCCDGVFGGFELCEDGGTQAGDGCSPSCAVEVGFTCTGTVISLCVPICGDGLVRGREGCDDGNTGAGDGCRADCEVEDGFSCAGEPSVCQSCGDGAVQGTEACDDGNASPGDGCGASCTIDAGWACPAAGGACAQTCGDGTIDANELCDDGNTAAGDGCGPSCAIEPGWMCATSCTPICGDGLMAGVESCDDGNATPGDGCSATCVVDPGFICSGEPSACAPSCGDSIIAGGESCDDGGTLNGDGCSAACIREVGFLCTARSCSPVCSDGLIRGGEACDDHGIANGDGCSSSCTVEPGFVCTGEPSACAACGNGMLFGMEQCDDGNTSAGDGCSSTCTLEAGWSCMGAPSVCQNCGNGILEGTELCDAANIPNDDCFRHGYRPGAVGLTCVACTTVDPTTCSGGAIDSVAQLQAAIADAIALGGHETVAVHGGTYTVATTIELDECNGLPCTSAQPGLTLQPLAGAQVVFTGAPAGAIFRLRSGNNVLSGFSMVDVVQAVAIDAGSFSGGNRIDHFYFLSDQVAPGDLVHVGSSSNEISANRFENTRLALGGRAIRVELSFGNVIAMNAISGPFASGIDADFNGDTYFDHNSVWISSLSGTGIRVYSSSPSVSVCFRNNIVVGNAASIGIDIGMSSRFRACGGVNAGSNVNIASGTQCTGRCNDCTGAGPACDLAIDPGFAGAVLCLAPGNALIDTGRNVGQDLDDGSANLYQGTGPDVGAHESGTTRRFGGMDAICP